MLTIIIFHFQKTEETKLNREFEKENHEKNVFKMKKIKILEKNIEYVQIIRHNTFNKLNTRNLNAYG